MKNTWAVAFFIFSLIFWLQCQPHSPKQAPINPNGDSEMALLMRAMFEECANLGENIEKGKINPLKVGLEDLLTAEGTQPEKVNSPEFKAMAKSYLDIVNYFNEEEDINPEQGYTMVLNSCITCHQAMCPGPIKKIEKLLPQ
ncbi:MAG: hypothetical protein AAF502_25615 [Bacteroidota bacterium]